VTQREERGGNGRAQACRPVRARGVTRDGCGLPRCSGRVRPRGVVRLGPGRREEPGRHAAGHVGAGRHAAGALERGAGAMSPVLFRLTMFDREDLQKLK
jgi:hypothetical protein